MPLILAKYVSAFAANGGRSQGPLEITVGSTKKKIGIGVPRCHTRATVKIKFTIGVVAINQVLLIRREPGSKLPIIFPSRPGDRIGPGKGVFHVTSRTIFAWSEQEPGIEIKIGRAGGYVGSDVDAQRRAAGLMVDGKVTLVIAAVGNEMKFIEQGGREDSSVFDVCKIVIGGGAAGKPRDAGEWERVDGVSAV